MLHVMRYVATARLTCLTNGSCQERLRDASLRTAWNAQCTINALSGVILCKIAMQLSNHMHVDYL